MESVQKGKGGFVSWESRKLIPKNIFRRFYVEQTDILTYMYEEYYTLGRDWSHPDLIPSFSSLAPATVTGEAKVVFLSLEDLTRRVIHQVFKNG